jgi:hypothetical protein
MESDIGPAKIIRHHYNHVGSLRRRSHKGYECCAKEQREGPYSDHIAPSYSRLFLFFTLSPVDAINDDLTNGHRLACQEQE